MVVVDEFSKSSSCDDSGKLGEETWEKSLSCKQRNN